MPTGAGEAKWAEVARDPIAPCTRRLQKYELCSCWSARVALSRSGKRRVLLMTIGCTVVRHFAKRCCTVVDGTEQDRTGLV